MTLVTFAKILNENPIKSNFKELNIQLPFGYLNNFDFQSFFD